MPDTVSLLVGTTKGLFILRGNADGTSFNLTGPHCEGWPINHAIADAASGTIWAAGGGEWFGAGVWRCDNGAWRLSRGGFDDVKQIWSLAQDGARLLAGTKPAALYESHDGGESWSKIQSLTDQPGADDWSPGAAGLVLHTILPGADGKLWVGISSAGAFVSPDGGGSWQHLNRRSNRTGPAGALLRDWGDGQEFRAQDEIFSCVHNMAFGAAPGLIYMQNHQGVYRSRDGGALWEEITDGLPSTFGFPVAAHPRDPDMLWVFPLNGDSQGRYPPDAKAAVWRSRDAGESWHPLSQGLPANDCFFTVLRQAMANDRADPAGVYFGTNTGSVFASRDEGDHWTEVARHLPTILSVEVMLT